ncbi:MAG: hypothetical protein AB1706_10195 [Pseudomonadota bacterium]
MGTTSGYDGSIIMDGWAEVELGGTVVRGDLLVATTDGKAVSVSVNQSGVAKPRAMALVSGASGDIIQIELLSAYIDDPTIIAKIADSAITAGNVIKIGDSDTDCDKATTSTDFLLGIALNSCATGEVCYFRGGGVAEAIAGASVTRGNLLTSNTASKAIAAAPAAGANARVVGVALESASANGLFDVLVSPGSVQGA